VDFVFLARDTGTITRTIARSKVPGKPEIREYKEHRGVYAYPSPA
jgi:hypothetical protein